MLTTLSAIVTEQAMPTTIMLQHAKQFLNYATSISDATITYHASNMALAIHSNASYLSKPKECSKAGGHFFLSCKTTFYPNNDAAQITVQVIKSVMSSAAEAILGGLYINAKQAAPMQQISLKGRTQPPTPVQADNLMA